MVSKKMRVSVGVIILVAVWLLFSYEAMVGDFFVNGAAVVLVASVGSYFGARLLGLRFPK